jgi:peptidyl-prolyl cis-trans isomerase SurA
MDEIAKGRFKHHSAGRSVLLTLFMMISAVFCLPPALLGAEVVDRIVAIVNDDIITLYDLNQALQPYEDNIDALNYSTEQKRSALFQFRQKLLNELISQKLTEQEVQRYKIAVSEEEIDNYIERIKETKYLTDEELRKSLMEQGLTMDAYRAEIKRQIQRTRLVNREVKSKVVITKEDIAAYYEAHQEKYGGDRQYHLWNLFVRLPPGAGEYDRQEARDALNAHLAKIKQGVPFKDVVDEANKSDQVVRGSDLGLFRLAELSPQLQKTIGAMEPKQCSEIIETEIGYQVVYLQDVIASQAKPLAEVESEIQDILFQEVVDNKFQAWIEELRKRSLIKVIN